VGRFLDAARVHAPPSTGLPGPRLASTRARATVRRSSPRRWPSSASRSPRSSSSRSLGRVTSHSRARAAVCG
jgi:hypothetical protein